MTDHTALVFDLDEVDVRRMPPQARAALVRYLDHARRLDADAARAAARAARARAEFVAAEPRTAAVRARIAAALGRPS